MKFARDLSTTLATALMACVCYGQSNPTNAVVEVDAARVLKPVKRQIFGANIEWFHNGDQIWDPATSANRPILIERAKELGVSLLRVPGGTLADYYHWRDGIGPQQNRRVSPHGVDPGASPQTFGLHEYMDFVRRSSAQPMFQVNMITGGIPEAEDWVRYANSPTHPERAANGSPLPFGVKYWEIGNEQYMPNWDQYSFSSLLPVEEYATRFNGYARAMKAVDPTISIGAVGGANFGRYRFLVDDNWNRTLLQREGANIDFLAVHNAYGPVVLDAGTSSFTDVYSAMLAFPKLVEQNLQTINSQIEQYAPAHAGRIKIGITEWGPLFSVSPSSPYVGHNKTLGAGVFTASMLRTFLLADRVEIANIFQLTEPIFMGIMDHNGVVKPSYLAMKLYSKHFGTNLVHTASTSPSYNSVSVGLVDAVPNVPYVEAISSLSADGKKLYVMVINKHLSSRMNANVQIRNFAPRSTVTVRTLTAASPDANNGNDLLEIPGIMWATQAVAPGGSFNSGAPGTVQITQRLAAMASPYVYSAPPMSVTVLEFAAR